MRPYKKIALVLVITIILVRVCSMLFEKGFKKYNKPYFEKMDYVFYDSSYNDIIYLGNSRANFGINPWYIDSICNTKSYNLGMAGADITDIIFFLNSYLQHHPAPKKIVFCYDYSLFRFSKYHEFAPVFFYYLRQENIKKQVASYGENVKLLQWFPDLKYCFFNDYSRASIIRGLAGRILTDLSDKRFRRTQFEYRGFINFYPGTINLKEFPDSSDYFIQNKTINQVNALVDICNKNRIKIIFIYTPELHPPDKLISGKILLHKRTVDSMITSICFKNNFYYKRFDLPSFESTDFSDYVHVNIPGSEKFSIMLGNYLKIVSEAKGKR